MKHLKSSILSHHLLGFQETLTRKNTVGVIENREYRPSPFFSLDFTEVGFHVGQVALIVVVSGVTILTGKDNNISSLKNLLTFILNVLEKQ